MAALSVVAPLQWSNYSAAVLDGGGNPTPERVREFERQQSNLARAAPRAFRAWEIASDAHARATELLRDAAQPEYDALETILLTERAGVILDELARDNARP